MNSAAFETLDKALFFQVKSQNVDRLLNPERDYLHRRYTGAVSDRFCLKRFLVLYTLWQTMYL